MNLRFIVTAGALLLTAACSSSSADLDAESNPPNADEEVQASGTKPAEPAEADRGCPSQPTCTDRANDGSFCAPICAPECQSKHISSAMWDSPYEVGGSFGLGRHQGIAILTVAYTFDERAPKDGKSAALISLPPDMEAVMLAKGDAAHDHSAFTLCDAPSITHDAPLANHGRALSRAPEHAESRISVAHHADVRPGVQEQAAAAKANRRASATARRMERWGGD